MSRKNSSLSPTAWVSITWKGVVTLIALSLGGIVSTLAGPVPPGPHNPPPPSETRRVRQPLQEYLNVFTPRSAGKQKFEMAMNPFLAYTHLGSDFGFIGEGEQYIGWEPGLVVVDTPQGSWGGMWHGLAGVGDDMDMLLDFRACYPPVILSRYQPQIVGLELRARGKGVIKVDIKTSTESTQWTHPFTIDSPDLTSFAQTLDPESIGRAKYLNWVAEGGTNAAIESVGFIVKTPDIPFDEYVFLASYAKLARCYNQTYGLVSDRAHSRDGYFVNVPTSGMFCLGTALASGMGMVTDETARLVLHRTHDNISKLEAPMGVLPHFIKSSPDGNFHILPGTEYSTVDTSIYYHSMLLAAKILEDEAVTHAIEGKVEKISFNHLLDGNGFIRHGLCQDGVTAIPHSWHDWGGETALVLALNAMTEHAVPPKMDPSGHFNKGTGFLAEVQSLFYPEFDSPSPDLLTKQNWLAARQEMLDKQKSYFKTSMKDSPASVKGYYGLSAGEGVNGFGYLVNGVDNPNQVIIHPHYMLMSACLEKEPASIYGLMRKMEQDQLFPPWGLVEHFAANDLNYLPMQGALNASFETLGAYHLLAKNRKAHDVVYEAALNSPLLRRGASVFYPGTALTKL